MIKTAIPNSINKSFVIQNSIYITNKSIIYKIKDISNDNDKILKISDYNKNELNLLNIIKKNNNKFVLTPEYICTKKGLLFVVYPYKTSLFSKLQSDQITFKDIVNLTLDICSGILFLHEKKYLHLDISPNNIFVNDDGTFCIGDYSSVKKSNQKKILQNLYFTPGYSPPEFHVQENKNILINELSDEYSLATTILSLCNLNKSNNYNEMSENHYDIPEDFIKILQKASSEVQEFRYQSLYEFQKDVLNFQNEYNIADVKFRLLLIQTNNKSNNSETIPLDKECVQPLSCHPLGFINSAIFMTIIILLAILLPTFALYNIFFVSHTSHKNYTEAVAIDTLVNSQDNSYNNNLQKRQKLKEFDFENTIIYSITPKVIENNCKNKPDFNSLKIISANNNCISDITELASFPNIEELYLSSNKIKNINSLTKLNKLKTLVISVNLLEDVSALSKITSLENLDLSGNNRLKNITTLSKLKSLKLLCLNNTNITRNELTALKKSLPKCNIII